MGENPKLSSTKEIRKGSLGQKYHKKRGLKLCKSLKNISIKIKRT
jgi:hypothetical protein